MCRTPVCWVLNAGRPAARSPSRRGPSASRRAARGGARGRRARRLVLGDRLAERVTRRVAGRPHRPSRRRTAAPSRTTGAAAQASPPEDLPSATRRPDPDERPRRDALQLGLQQTRARVRERGRRPLRSRREQPSARRVRQRSMRNPRGPWRSRNVRAEPERCPMGAPTPGPCQRCSRGWRLFARGHSIPKGGGRLDALRQPKATLGGRLDALPGPRSTRTSRPDAEGGQTLTTPPRSIAPRGPRTARRRV